MVYKIMGTAMIFISSALMSNTLMLYEKKKIRQIDSFIALIKYIRNQIECYSMPIDKILLSCPKEMLYDIWVEDSADSFDKLINGCDMVCGAECGRILEEFSRSLGKNYRERQIKLCDNAVRELEPIRQGLYQSYPSRKKTITALCFAMGGLAVILLI